MKSTKERHKKAILRENPKKERGQDREKENSKSSHSQLKQILQGRRPVGIISDQKGHSEILNTFFFQLSITQTFKRNLTIYFRLQKRFSFIVLLSVCL